MVFIQKRVGQWRPSDREHVNRVLQFGHRCTFYNDRYLQQMLGEFSRTLSLVDKCCHWDAGHLLAKPSLGVGRCRQGDSDDRCLFCISIVNVYLKSQLENTRIVNIGDGNVRGWE